MPHFDIVRESAVEKSFRVASVIGAFDIESNKIKERFSGEIPIENMEWNIGVIFGASGTGKSTIARELFPANYIQGFDYGENSILDDMPEGLDVRIISRTFAEVGFASPPSWLKPYSVLSTGEKMRVDLARAILEGNELIVFDEFTSVVNREVACVGSYAIQKAIRRMKKRFIAVSCHDDILKWLEPDWVFDTNVMQFKKKDSDAPKSFARFGKSRGNIGKSLGSITI